MSHHPQHIRVLVHKRHRVCDRVVNVGSRIRHLILSRCVSLLLLFPQLQLETLTVQVLLATTQDRLLGQNVSSSQTFIVVTLNSQ